MELLREKGVWSKDKVVEPWRLKRETGMKMLRLM